jgi:hypothetical protein
VSNFIAISFAKTPGFYLVGTFSGTLGKVLDGDNLSDAYIDITGLIGPCSAKPNEATLIQAPCNFMLASPLRIPGALITNDRVSTSKELNDQLALAAAALRTRFMASVAEAIRRAASVVVDLKGNAFLKPMFLGMSPSNGAFVSAHLRLDIWEVKADVAPAELTVKTGAALEFGASMGFRIAGIERTCSLIVMLNAALDARVRIDADDLGLSFPSFNLSGFDLAVNLPPLDLAEGLNNAVSSLKEMIADVDVAVTHTNAAAGPAKLVLRQRQGSAGIDWLVVTGDYADEPLGTTDKVAEFKVTTSSAAAPALKVEITDLRLGDVAGREIFGGKVAATATPIALPGNVLRRLGPFEISWQHMTLTPSHEGNNFGAGAPTADGATLRARIDFTGLTLRVADDPDAFLTFDGAVEIDPSGARLLKLSLVQPYPLVMLANAADDLMRAGAGVLHVVANLANITREKLQKLLGILGQMAAALGRAAILIAEKAGNALGSLGDMLANAVAGIGEMLAELFNKLGEFMPAGLDNHLALEVRIATRPLALQQVLVTLKKPLPKQSRDLLGFKLSIPERWKAGLLLDFATQPGAYLVLHCDQDPGANELAIATLSSDLWLDRAGAGGKVESQALRDVDGKASEPAPRQPGDQPLLKLDLGLKTGAGAATTMLVLAGLNRGQTVFFQRLAGKSTAIPIPGQPGLSARSIDGPFRLEPLSDDNFNLDVKLATERILPLLGMGASGDKGTAGGPDFLSKLQQSLANVVWVKDTKSSAKLATREVDIDLLLGLKAAGLETTLDLKAILSLDSLAMRLQASNVFPIASERIEEEALGLVWIIEQADEEARRANAKVDMFSIGFAGGQSGFELNREKARMQLRFNGLSSDGQGVVFEVDTFKIGPGGLDLVARVADKPVRLNGIDVPFHFTEGKLEIKGGRLVSAMVAGRGALPPDLIGEADCTIALTFGEVPGEGIVLQSGKVELDKKNDPIICHAARFTLTISDLDIAFVKDGGYHFYYLVTGTLRFSPKDGEFESGLLQYLDGVEMNLERTPLSADPRVLVKHISFQKTLNPKKSFNLFNLFTFELRGFGYHPASPKFAGAPAVNISGQIKFVEIGDVMAPSIDFHGLWIAPPRENESLPRIKADGLGIDLNLKGAIRVRGTVIAVDADTRTVEGSELAPEGYNAYGFLGRGEFDIPGWGAMGASLGFLELERQDRPGERRKSFYFYAEKKKMAIEIPTPVWNFYLREAGFGLGFRYTLAAIAAADNATSVPKLINALDQVSKTAGDLHKFSAWKPEPEGDRVTLALKGAIQVYPAQKSWDEEAEKQAQNPFMFDLVAAIRSDFTLFMGLRGWVGTNYIDYLNDKDDLRSNPGLRGYLYISAPQQRLLARMIGDSKGYIGDRIPALAEGSPLRKALQSVDWSATLFIKPGLFHYELGWPNQLSARLFDDENMRVTVRGGMIFRAAEDGLLWGYNIEADAYFRFGGSVQIGPVGVCAEATLTASLLARVICYLSWRFAGSLIYGLVALDAKLVVNFRAWMEIDLGIKKFTIRIGFSRTLQFSAAIELALSPEGIGARVNARVAVSVFGATLSVSVGFVLGSGTLDEARARVQRFLAMSITAEEPDAAPAALSQSGDQRMEQDAQHAQAGAGAPKPADVSTPGPGGTTLPASQTRAKYGTAVRETAFWCVLHQAAIFDGAQAPAGYGYAVLLPREARLSQRPGDDGPDAFLGAFYAPARFFMPASGQRNTVQPAHYLYLSDSVTDAQLAALNRLQRCEPGARRSWVPLNFQKDQMQAIAAQWNNPIETEDGSADLTLALVFDECYLSDTEWHAGIGDAPPYRRTTAWAETPVRIHGRAKRPAAGTEQERNAERDSIQRARAAQAAANPVVEGALQARSSVLAMFADQFVTLAQNGLPSTRFAHVTDLGLVFYGKLEDLEQLAMLQLVKNDLTGPRPKQGGMGEVSVLNPLRSWFVTDDPVLASDRSTIGHEGIKLGWELSTAFADAADAHGSQADPEHFLHHYEIVRTVEGLELTPHVVEVKAAATLGGRDSDSAVTLLAPEWQFTDDLADLEPDLRRALLPTKDDDAAFEAAVGWSLQVGEQLTLSVSYTVTPVDIAGSRGMPKSFLVDIDRPSPQLRPAQAELRFIVHHLGSVTGGTHHSGAMPAGALGVLLAVGDRSPVTTAGGTISRHYYLIADPDNISPSGHYGTDGLSERRPGLASMALHSADERIWQIAGGQFISVLTDEDTVRGDNPVHQIESEEQTLRTYPAWCRLAGSSGIAGLDKAVPVNAPLAVEPKDSAGFLDSLWRRDGANAGPRIATRFWLQTVHVVEGKHEGGKPYTVIKKSQRVPVNIEVVIAPQAGHQKGLMRPEAFEWPVHLELPPHGPGQVRASSGFARFRAPPADDSLKDFLDKDGRAGYALVRDPERRILTEISFDAQPAFAHAPGMAVDRTHASSIAGFDVYELDLDDLAALDTDITRQFETSATTWDRARRVARIERVAPAMARLLPDSNRDWSGWHAHYPSETWRLQQRAVGRSGQAQPRRAAWYSAAESSVLFAARVPRSRLFPTASEAAVADLLRFGIAEQLVLTLAWSVADNAGPELKALAATLSTHAKLACHHLGFGSPQLPRLALTATEANGAMVLHPTSGGPFDAARLRAALMGVCWTPGVELSAAQARAVAAGEGIRCALTVEGRRGVKGKPAVTGTVQQPLVLSAFLHPILEEVFGELEYSTSHDRLYRRYVVSVQPVQPLEVTTMAAFLADSNPEADPYGWGVLQQLGLAGTVKLYDRDLDCFLDAGALLKRIAPVLQAAVARYQNSFPDADKIARCYGQPLVEILMRPGQDRRGGPFEAVLADAGVEAEAGVVNLADEALAIAQISLRPAPAAARRYLTLSLEWEAGFWPHQLKLDGTASRTLLGYEVEFTAGALPCELIFLQDGAMRELNAEPVRFPLIAFPKGALADGARTPLQFLLRTTNSNRPGVALVARVRTVSATGKATDALVSFDELKKMAVEPRRTDMAFPTTPFKATGQFNVVDSPAGADPQKPVPTAPAPWERFGALSPDTWAEALAASGAAASALQSLRENLRYVAPALAWPGPVWVDQVALADVKQVAAAYVPWWQRFLDHAAAPDRPAGSVHFAIAAPIRANPLKLAADANGQLGLSFLHADRWAHARVYAVRPTPRYQNLALGAGYYREQSESEQLVTAALRAGPVLRNALGYALAVSPRTERIEPPVILGSQLVQGGRTEWELVVARHGEEALAFSNRALFARLGSEGTALSFIREYRDPQWPDKLLRLADPHSEPCFSMYPERKASLAHAAPDVVSSIGDLALARLAGQYPSLWKGADIWRIAELPAHYRVSALAVARAGLVVSRVVCAVQDATPRRPLALALRVPAAQQQEEAVRLLGEPLLVIERAAAGAPAAVAVQGLRMVSHADLSETESHSWFTGGEADIAWLPDPNVRYTVLRRGPLGEGRSFEDEDAQVSLIARPLSDKATDFEPVVLALRGTRFVALANPPVAPAVTFRTADAKRQFLLSFPLPMAPAKEQALRLAGALAGTEAQADSFNLVADNFARILTRVTLAYSPLEGAPERPDAVQWLAARALALRDHAHRLAGRGQARLQPAIDALAALALGLEAEALAIGNGQWPPADSLNRVRTAVLLMENVQRDTLGQDAPFGLSATDGERMLLVRDVPTSEEANKVLADAHPVAAKAGKLWAVCRERLLGGGRQMAIRAVDTRNEVRKDVVNGMATWSAPGEMEGTLSIPAWTKWAD